MKKYLLLFWGILFTTSAYSQFPAEYKKILYNAHNIILCIPENMFLTKTERLDTCKLRVTYELQFVVDTLHREKKDKDIQFLDIGKKVSKIYSYKMFESDSLITAMKKKGAETFPTVKDQTFSEEVYFFSNDNKVQVFERPRTPCLVCSYWYREDIPQINWKLFDESKIILGYRCQKAIGHFRGRDYVAWFTMDIPVKSGPYKFSGLPGLILELSDTSKDFNWICIGLQKGNNKMFVNRYTSNNFNSISTTRGNARKEIKRLLDDPAGYLEMIGRPIGQYINNRAYNATCGDLPPEPYNPIEKE